MVLERDDVKDSAGKEKLIRDNGKLKGKMIWIYETTHHS